MLRLRQEDEEIEKAGTLHVHSITEHLSYMAKPPPLRSRATFIILSEKYETQVSMSGCWSVGSGASTGLMW